MGGIYAVSEVALLIAACVIWRDPKSAPIFRGEPAWLVVLGWCLILLAAPILAGYGLYVGVPRATKWLVGHLLLGRTADPFSAPETEWRRDRDGVICDLIRRRKLYDARLKREDIGDWPMFQCWAAPDATILEMVDGHRDLHAAGLADGEIWERLDRHFGVHWQPVPAEAGVVGYLQTRLLTIDEGLLALGEEFLARHVAICLGWLERQPSIRGDGWCPPEWLTGRATLEEFAAGVGVKLQADGAPAILFLGGGKSQRDLVALTLRILDGDELWAYSSPSESWTKLIGRAGYALVRDGRIIANAVTAMN